VSGLTLPRLGQVGRAGPQGTTLGATGAACRASRTM
jgi:hypothetical protein